MKQRLLSLIMLLTSIVSWGYELDRNVPLPGTYYEFAPDFEADGLYYRIIGNNGVELTRAEGSTVTVEPYNRETFTVPSSVTHDGVAYPVTRIGDCTFYKDLVIKKLILPEGMAYIGGYAFCQSTIEELNFPTTLRNIGKNAFMFCLDLKEVVIPDDVKKLRIEEGAFCACSYLKKFTIGRGVTYMGDNSLGGLSWAQPTIGGGGGMNKLSVATRLEHLYCPFEEPKFIGVDLISGFVPDRTDPVINDMSYRFLYNDCKLYVPVGSLERYNSVEPWKWFGHFNNIVEDPSLNSSLPEVAEDCEAIHVADGRIIGVGVIEVYDLGGREIARGVADELPQLPAGFYIVRNSHTTAKIAIR